MSKIGEFLKITKLNLMRTRARRPPPQAVCDCPACRLNRAGINPLQALFGAPPAVPDEASSEGVPLPAQGGHKAH